MALKLTVSKLHVAGNGFVVIEASDREEQDWRKLSMALCRHRYGIGADGLLVLIFDEHRSDKFEMRMFNPDGTEDGCGNGLICATRFAYERMLSKFGSAPPSFIVRTIWGDSNVRILNDDSEHFEVDAELTKPKWHPKEIPMRVGKGIVCGEPCNVNLKLHKTSVTLFPVNTGSTHSVIFLDDEIDDETFEALSAEIERHKIFPQRTSVMWAKVMGENEVAVRSYERGVGETLSCGTGACAVAAVGIKLGFLNGLVKVNFKGGSIFAYIDWDGKLHIRGVAHRIFEAIFEAGTKGRKSTKR